jgi:hypothetical protein
MKKIFTIFCFAVILLLCGRTTSMATGWTNKSPNGTSTFYYVAYGHNCFIAVDYGGGIYKSIDYGQTWTLKATLSATPAYITYGNGKFIATDNNGRDYIFYSTNDGDSWTGMEVASGVSGGMAGIIYGSNGFAAASNNGSGYANIYKSSDGNSWSQVLHQGVALSNIGYGNGTYVAVGQGCIFTSTDASVWTSRTSPTSQYLQGVAYGNGIFVAVAFTGAIIRSIDNGVSWTSVTSGTSNDLNCVAYGNGYFYAVGADGLIIKSTNGTSWSAETSNVVDNLWGIDYGNGYFVATGENGAITVNNVPAKPTITTTAASSIALTSATLGGNVTEDGSLTVTERGIVYSLSSANTNPQIGGTGVTKLAHTTGGTGSFSQSISSLSQGTSYHYNAYATNSLGTSYGTASSFTTLYSVPTIQASAVTFNSNATGTTLTINWTNGNGANRAVFMKELVGTITNPTNGTTYTASMVWSSKGDQLGTSGYYCIYNGTETSVAVTGTTPNTLYVVQAFEYNGTGSGSVFNTSTATGNPSNDSSLPVELTSFTASTTNNKVTLNWNTATEVNNYGFEIERIAVSDKLLANSQQLNTNSWVKIAFVQGSGNSNSPKNYSFTDTPTGRTEFQYRLKQIDLDGKYEYSNVVTVELAAPTNFAVEQNFPNPFNPTTSIQYQVSGTSNVTLKVYDVLGKEVATLVNETKVPGKYEIKFDGSNLSSGIYFYTLHAGTFVQTKKIILMK